MIVMHCYDLCYESNMAISTGKIQAMVVSREPIRCKLAVNDKIINQVTK